MQRARGVPSEVDYREMAEELTAYRLHDRSIFIYKNHFRLCCAVHKMTIAFAVELYDELISTLSHATQQYSCRQQFTDFQIHQGNTLEVLPFGQFPQEQQRDEWNQK